MFLQIGANGSPAEVMAIKNVNLGSPTVRIINVSIHAQIVVTGSLVPVLQSLINHHLLNFNPFF